MRWKRGRRSENIDDRRGSPAVKRGAAVGGIGTLIVIVVALFLRQDPQELLKQLPVGGGAQQQQQQPRDPEARRADDQLADFVSVVLADTEDTWNVLFRKMGKQYKEPKLVLFTGAVQSACGFAESAMGPFYCPADEQVYIDLSFYQDLKNKLGAPGDFAQAYVIAHEVGHHIQNLLGTSDMVHRARSQVSKEEYNQLSVRLELQADFLAGVWAHHAQKVRHILDPNDIEEALNAANAIGDDRLQKRSRGYVVPESFTHGTSEQRMRWFLKGFKSGDVAQGDTFKAARL